MPSVENTMQTLNSVEFRSLEQLQKEVEKLKATNNGLELDFKEIKQRRQALEKKLKGTQYQVERMIGDNKMLEKIVRTHKRCKKETSAKLKQDLAMIKINEAVLNTMATLQDKVKALTPVLSKHQKRKMKKLQIKSASENASKAQPPNEAQPPKIQPSTKELLRIKKSQGQLFSSKSPLTVSVLADDMSKPSSQITGDNQSRKRKASNDTVSSDNQMNKKIKN